MVEVVKGTGALRSAFSSAEGSSWVVMTGSTSFAASGASRALSAFFESGARHVVVEGPLPNVDEVDRLVGQFRERDLSGLVGVGGGLVIDSMKAAALALMTGVSTRSLLDHHDAPSRFSIEKVAVPTTAGSGAERTPFAVLYRDGIKHSVDDPRLLPDRALVDPALSRSVPKHVAAAAALDAMAHCIESMWACKSTPESTEIAASALRQIVVHIEPAVTLGSQSASEALMYAASEAGAAIAVSRTTAAHALSYHLTSRYGLGHGHAVALTLGRLIEFNGGVAGSTITDLRGVDHVRAAVEQVCSALGLDAPEEAPGRLRRLIRSLGLSESVDEAAGKRVDRQRWLSEVNMERLDNNPRRLGSDDLAGIVTAV